MNFRKLQIRIFILSWLSYAFYYVSRKNFSVVKSSLSEDLNFTMVQLGTIETLYAACYMLGQFISGALGDRIGPRKVLTFGMLGSALSSIIMGLSISYSIFAFSLVFNGLFQSTGWPSNLKVITPWFEKENRGRITGLWCTCYTVGPLIATALATWLLVSYSWQAAFIFPGVAVAFIALLIFLFLIDSPEDAGFASKTPPTVLNSQEKKAPFFQMITNSKIVTYGICYAFNKFVRYSFTFWLPWYLYQKMNFSKSEAGYISMSLEIGGFFGVIGIGLLSDRLCSSNRIKIVIFSIIAMAASLFIYQVMGSQSIIINILLLALIGFMLFGGDSVLAASATQDIGGNKAAASAAGIVNGIGSIGGACGGIVPAVIAQNFGWDALFYLLILSTIISAIILYICTQRQLTESRPTKEFNYDA